MDESSEEEFFEDFGSGLSDEALAALLVRARASGDRDVRLLVKQYRALRRATRDLLATLGEAPDLAVARDGAPAQLARVLTGVETRTG